MQNDLLNERKENYTSSIVDMDRAKKLLKIFCESNNVFAFFTDSDGQWITDIYGNEEEVSRIKEYITPKQFHSIIEYVRTSKIEDQIIENTEYPNLKISAVSIKNQGQPIVQGIIIGVLSDADSMGYEKSPLEGFRTVTTNQKFLAATDFAHIISKTILINRVKLFDALAENRKVKNSHLEISASLKRNDTLTSILQLLESESSVEHILGDILEYAGKYLGISSAQVFRVNVDSEYIDVVAEWLGTGIISIFDKTQNIMRPSFLTLSDKPIVYSSGGSHTDAEKASLDEVHISATIIMPIMINGKISMSVCFNSCRQERDWTIDEIRFTSDVVKIMQSILIRRIQKNSLASSFASLEAILDNIGCSIYVWDASREKVLFMNREIKAMFAKKGQEFSANKYFDTMGKDYEDGIYERYDEDTDLWYDVHVNHINWVDGREVVLVAMYDITDKKVYQRRIEQLAYTDFLTGLFNRMCCERDLARYIDDAKHDKTQGALLYLDLDDFKHINDGLGHQYGDALLKSIAHSLQRVSGIEKTCYRMGGDEFVILVPPDNFQKFILIQEQIKEIFSNPWFLKDADYYCTMSMGTVTYPTEGDNVQELIKKADIAMYEAKKSGKNRVAHYSDSISSGSNSRLDLEKNMRDSISKGLDGFQVYFQPITDIQKEGRPCTGAEALVRWDSPEMGFMTPGAFIPLAEYLGLIIPIGNFVLKKACYALKRWNENGHPNYKVNVNLSVVQLLQNNIVEVIDGILEETGVNPKNLVLEVTESLAIDDLDRMKQILHEIKKLGVRIALDDFGTGYSSLNHIRNLPIDVIKVDQTFVKELTEDHYSQSFIKMVAELANTINVSICVEGIETEEQYKVLEGMKVCLVQGYYFGRPMAEEDFDKKYM